MLCRLVLSADLMRAPIKINISWFLDLLQFAFTFILIMVTVILYTSCKLKTQADYWDSLMDIHRSDLKNDLFFIIICSAESCCV